MTIANAQLIACIGLHVVQRSAVLADTDIRLIVKTQPVSVKIGIIRKRER